MDPKPVTMSLDVFGAALADGQRCVFRFELLGGVFEKMATLQLAGAVLELKREVPILRNFLSVLEVSFLRAGAMIAPSQICRTLPKRAVFTPVNVELFANNNVIFGRVPRLRYFNENVHFV
jgi:hypothetical protein